MIRKELLFYVYYYIFLRIIKESVHHRQTHFKQILTIIRIIITAVVANWFIFTQVWVNFIRSILWLKSLVRLIIHISLYRDTNLWTFLIFSHLQFVEHSLLLRKVIPSRGITQKCLMTHSVNFFTNYLHLAFLEFRGFGNRMPKLSHRHHTEWWI